MYYLNSDKEGYLLSVSGIGGGAKAEIDLGEYDFSGVRMNAYRMQNGKLVFDEERYKVLEEQQLMREEAEKEKLTYEKRIYDLEEALELLLSGGFE